MKPHDRLTIFRNLSRVRELQEFRAVVERYFICAERDVNDDPADWQGALAARSRINQMLLRILEIVEAAGLGRGEILQQIFSSRYSDGGEQEIFDFLDRSVGVYQGGRYAAMVRTINPVFYAGSLLSYLARVPKRILLAVGLWPQRRATRLNSADLARLEAVSGKFADAEDLIDSRFALLQDRQAQRNAEVARQLAELAERLDFAERVLAQQHPPKQLGASDLGKINTPR